MSFKLYIAGPMSGLPEFNYPAFHEAAQRLRAVGYEIENPAENSGEPDWIAYMRVSLRQVSRVDGIAVLRGWELSRGANLEVHIAHALHLPVLPVDAWISTSASAA